MIWLLTGSFGPLRVRHPEVEGLDRNQVQAPRLPLQPDQAHFVLILSAKKMNANQIESASGKAGGVARRVRRRPGNELAAREEPYA